MANGYIRWIKEAHGTVVPVTAGWIKGAFKRHPDFKKWWNDDRDENAKPAAAILKDEKDRLDRFLQAWIACIDGANISSANTYVLSHTAYALAVGREIKATIPHQRRAKRPDPREVASVITAFSGRGVRLPPYFIFKRTGQGPGSTNHSANVRVHWNSTGWIDDAGVLFDWLGNTFERETNPERKTGRDAPARVILFDDEKFNISPDFFVSCCSKNIFLFSFPRDSGKVFSPLEDAVTAIVDAKYGQYMSDKFHRNENQLFRMEQSRFSRLVRDELTDSELDPVGEMAWADCGLMPPSPKVLSDLIGRDLNTPAPDPWGSPQVARLARSASRPARPIQTPITSGREQIPISVSDDVGDTSETPGVDEWCDDGDETASTAASSDDGEEPALAAQSPQDEDASSGEDASSDEDEPVPVWEHPVDREDFVKFVEPLFSGERDGKAQQVRRDGLMDFFGGYQRLCRKVMAGYLHEAAPETPKKRSSMLKTSSSSKRRRLD